MGTGRAGELDVAIRAALDRLAAIDDPLERARAAATAVDVANEARGQFARARRDAIRAMRARGDTWVAIGQALNVAAARAQQLADR